MGAIGSRSTSRMGAVTEVAFERTVPTLLRPPPEALPDAATQVRTSPLCGCCTALHKRANITAWTGTLFDSPDGSKIEIKKDRIFRNRIGPDVFRCSGALAWAMSRLGIKSSMPRLPRRGFRRANTSASAALEDNEGRAAPQHSAAPGLQICCFRARGTPAGLYPGARDERAAHPGESVVVRSET